MTVPRRTALKFTLVTLAAFGLTNAGSVAEGMVGPFKFEREAKPGNGKGKPAPAPAPPTSVPGAPVLMVTFDHVAPTPLTPAAPHLTVVFS